MNLIENKKHTCHLKLECFGKLFDKAIKDFGQPFFSGFTIFVLPQAFLILLKALPMIQ